MHNFFCQISSLLQIMFNLKVFYSEAMLFSIALYQINIYIGILYLDSNQRKLYVWYYMKTWVHFVYILNNQSHCPYPQLGKSLVWYYAFLKFSTIIHCKKIVNFSISFWSSESILVGSISNPSSHLEQKKS